MRATLRSVARIATFVAVTGLGASARAGEPADRGISMSAWAGAAVDRSVIAADGGRPLRDGTPIFGVTTLGNIGRLAMGGAVDGTPSIGGDGRLSLGLLLGFEPQVGSIRIQVLGEGGSHRFSQVGGSLLGRQVGPDPWVPFAGVRLGVSRTVPAHGLFELGGWFFGRYDIGSTTVTNVGGLLGQETRTDYRVGGVMVGFALQVGMRLEASDPSSWEGALAVE
jgi:hypothetical protein